MGWEISFTPKAKKELAKLGKPAGKKIAAFLREKVALDPKASGGQLKGHLKEFWRWRVGEYRILGRIEEDKVLVLVIHVGHRRNVYGGH